MTDISIVIPCYGSKSTLSPLVSRIVAAMADLPGSYEVVLVVDGDTDGTWDVASDLATRHEPVQAIQLARNYGQHNALIAGIRTAQYDLVVTMDDDLQHRPEEISKLLSALTPDLDLVYGIPAVEEHGAARSLASRMVKAGMSSALGVRNAKLISAFRVFRTFLRDGFDRSHWPDVSLDVALSWSTTRVGATTVQMDERTDGQSGYTIRRLFKHALNMLLGYSTKPLRIVTYLGMIVGAGGIILATYVLWMYFTGETTVAGFTTIASLVAIFSSAQLIGIGVLGEYIGRIHFGGMGRPTYVIRDRVGAPRQRTAEPAVLSIDKAIGTKHLLTESPTR